MSRSSVWNLKDDVIRFCEQVARDLGYDGLSFLTGDIQSYVSGEPKERFSALLTDSIRGQLLEACGYDVNIMEFISLEHIPKNILIKAVRNGRPDRQKYQEYLAFAKDWQIRPYLEEELARIGRIPERAE